MDVPVALPAAEAQHVQPLGFHLGHQRLAGGMHDSLHGQIVRRVHGNHVLDVRRRRDEQVARPPREATEEGHRGPVPVDDVVGIVRAAGK
jgi:hypothetical protein